MKIRVVKVNMGEKPRITEIEDSLEASQEIVGGYIERVAIGTEIDLWLNEEGKLDDDLNENIVLVSKGRPYDVVHGNVFFTSHDDEGNTVSLTDEQIEDLKKRTMSAVTPTGEELMAIIVD